MTAHPIGIHSLKANRLPLISATSISTLRSRASIQRRADFHSKIYLFVNTFRVPNQDYKEVTTPSLVLMLLKLSGASILET